jgi:hypothetical protein
MGKNRDSGRRRLSGKVVDVYQSGEHYFIKVKLDRPAGREPRIPIEKEDFDSYSRQYNEERDTGGDLEFNWPLEFRRVVNLLDYLTV